MRGGVIISRKKIIGILLIATIIGSSGVYGFSKVFAVSSKATNVTLLDYTPAKPIKKSFSFNLNSYTNKNSLGWLSDYEILTQAKKLDLENPNSIQEIMYLSIYNVDTGKSKDFADVKVGNFISISPDKKYALYEEPRNTNKISDDEWVKDMKSGKLYNCNVKLLNLITGEIIDLKTQYKNYEAEYQWIDNNKLFVFCPLENQQWEIVDLNGKVYKSGKIIDPKSNYHLSSIKILNAKVSENETTGDFILNYILPTTENRGFSEFLMVDINTNKEKLVYTSKGSTSYSIDNNILLIGEYCMPNSKLYYFDESGAKKGEYSFEGRIDTGNFSISKDDLKVAIAEQIADSENKPLSYTTNLNILDLKSGKTIKPFQTTSIVDSKSMNINWNSNGNVLTFNVINKICNLNDTYLIRIQ